MMVAKSIAECRAMRAELGRSLAFVPTMGALHAGHMSLVHEAKRRATHVAVSVFVNPTQFGPNEDFAKYPRPIEEDLRMCRDAGADLVFLPNEADVYPAGSPKIVIEMPDLFGVLDGVYRPGHYAGVCQIVAKLFNIVQPSVSCFGEKDYQQLAIIRAMSKALDFPIEVIGCPTLRDPDGLAMSSRNRYLSGLERERALSISRGLFAIRDMAAQGERSVATLSTRLHEELLDPSRIDPRVRGVPVELQYATIVNATTLRPIETIDRQAQALIAMKVGTTRLIDNVRLQIG
jgi:pantoate--beta-alanine ligase